VGKRYSIDARRLNDQGNSGKKTHRRGGGGDHHFFGVGNSSLRRKNVGILRPDTENSQMNTTALPPDIYNLTWSDAEYETQIPRFRHRDGKNAGRARLEIVPTAGNLLCGNSPFGFRRAAPLARRQ
jgi:hypothetical protein